MADFCLSTMGYKEGGGNSAVSQEPFREPSGRDREQRVLRSAGTSREKRIAILRRLTRPWVEISVLKYQPSNQTSAKISLHQGSRRPRVSLGHDRYACLGKSDKRRTAMLAIDGLPSTPCLKMMHSRLGSEKGTSQAASTVCATDRSLPAPKKA